MNNEIMRTYGVWRETWGGPTGNRAGWLRAKGTLARFDSLEEAEAEANRLNERMNRHEHAWPTTSATAFRYSAREL